MKIYAALALVVFVCCLDVALGYPRPAERAYRGYPRFNNDEEMAAERQFPARRYYDDYNIARQGIFRN